MNRNALPHGFKAGHVGAGMPPRLSPSRLNTYVDCERCFWLEVNKGIKQPSGPFPSLPGGMDTIIKEHFDRFRDRGEVPPELAESGIDAVPYPDEEFLADARDWRSGPKWTDPETGAVLRGGVDDLLLQDGKVVILDYKTRGYPPKEEVPGYYARQVNLYNLMFHENGHDIADFGLLLYYYPDRVQEDGEVLFHNQFQEVPVDLDRARGLVREAVETLEGPIPGPSPDCEFCKWSAADHDF